MNGLSPAACSTAWFTSSRLNSVTWYWFRSSRPARTRLTSRGAAARGNIHCPRTVMLLRISHRSGNARSASTPPISTTRPNSRTVSAAARTGAGPAAGGSRSSTTSTGPPAADCIRF
jgi:hypothetical protein